MRRLFLGIASIVLATSAFASPATTESVETLLAATRAEKVLDSMFGNIDLVMRRSTATAFGGRELTDEQQRIADSLAAKAAVIFREEMSWTKIRPIYVRIYQETFTQEEVDGLIAFYRTPIGSSTVDKLPLALQNSITAMQPLMQPMMEKLKVAAQEAVAEAKAAK